MNFDFEIYKGKTFSSLMKDIVVNSNDRNETMEDLINQLKDMVKTPNDALLIVPLIREYLDVTVKNDEQLVKLAAIVQRLATNSNGSEDTNLGLSEEERKQLMGEVNEIVKEISNPINTKDK